MLNRQDDKSVVESVTPTIVLSGLKFDVLDSFVDNDSKIANFNIGICSDSSNEISLGSNNITIANGFPKPKRNVIFVLNQYNSYETGYRPCRVRLYTDGTLRTHYPNGNCVVNGSNKMLYGSLTYEIA